MGLVVPGVLATFTSDRALRRINAALGIGSPPLARSPITRASSSRRHAGGIAAKTAVRPALSSKWRCASNDVSAHHLSASKDEAAEVVLVFAADFFLAASGPFKCCSAAAMLNGP